MANERTALGSPVALTGVHAHYSWTGFNGFCKCPNGDLLVATPDGVGELTGPYYTTFMRCPSGSDPTNSANWTNEGAAGWDRTFAQFWLTPLADGRIVCTGSGTYDGSGNKIYVGNEGGQPWHLVTTLSVSSDNGQTWGTMQLLDNAHTGGAISGSSERGLVGGITVRPDGTWVAPFEVYYTAGPANVQIFTSTDSGANWTPGTVVMNGVADSWLYQEPTIDRLLDGRLVVTARTQESLSTPTQTQQSMWMAYSSDEGVTWTGHHRCFTSAASRAIFAVGPEGDLLAATRRMSGTTSTYTVYRQSWDDGLTWTSPVQVGPGYVNVYGQAAVVGAAGVDGNVIFAIGEETVGGEVYIVRMSKPAGVPIAAGYGNTTSAGYGDATAEANPGSLLVLPESSAWEQIDTSIIVRTVNEPCSVEATITGTSGGLLRFAGTDAARFDASLDGTTWAGAVDIPPGTSTVHLRVTPVTAGSTLSAQVGVPV